MTKDKPIINIYSPKGGTGTTSLAIMLAVKFAQQGITTLTVKDLDDALGIVGAVPTADICNPSRNLYICKEFKAGFYYEFTPKVQIFDVDDETCAGADINIVLIKNDYLSLRKVAKMGLQFDNLIVACYMHEGAALGIRDVECVTGRQDIVQLEWNAKVARSIDAGLLMGRPGDTPDALYTACLSIIEGGACADNQETETPTEVGEWVDQ